VFIISPSRAGALAHKRLERDGQNAECAVRTGPKSVLQRVKPGIDGTTADPAACQRGEKVMMRHVFGFVDAIANFDSSPAGGHKQQGVCRYLFQGGWNQLRFAQSGSKMVGSTD
jgi:hypothetical protein